MNILLILAFLFSVGSVLGWCLEVLFRKFFSGSNPEHRWVNPGFCEGPYLPLYGSGLCVLYLLASLEKYQWISNPVGEKILLFAFMAVAMTAIEYLAGILSVKFYHVRLWDYSKRWGNIQGIICPLFSFFWAVLGAVYYLAIHPYILDALAWLSANLTFSFFIGVFFGVFTLDLVNSMQLITHMKHFAEENDVVLKYEAIKLTIRNNYEETAQKYHFFRPFKTLKPLAEHLKERQNQLTQRMRKK